MHAVLQQLHPMIGLEFHAFIAPPVVPAGMSMQILNGLNVTSEYNPKHFTNWYSSVMLKGTDIGPGIGHVFWLFPIPALRIPLIILFSSSKSNFGASKYKTSSNLSPGIGKSVAVAALYYVNPNLNCGEPCNTPTGLVIAPNTHVAGMTWGDVLAGLASMTVDILLSAAMNALGGVITKGIATGAQSLGSKLVAASFAKWFAKSYKQSAALAGAGQLFKGIAALLTKPPFTSGKSTSQVISGAITQFFLGSPGGIDAGTDTDRLGFDNPLGSLFGKVAEETAKTIQGEPDEDKLKDTLESLIVPHFDSDSTPIF